MLMRNEHEELKNKFTYDAERLYDALVESTDDYPYVCNMETGVFCYSQKMVEEFNLPGQVIANAAEVWGAKVHELDKKAFLDANREITEGITDSHCVEYRAINRRGEWVWMRCRGHVERDGHGNARLFAGMITNLGKKNKIDPLTGLFNKYEFEARLQELLEASEVPKVTVLKLDIDDFKKINHLYSFDFGDQVIRIVAQKMQSLLPSNGSVYRLDGDEFGIIIRGKKEEADQFYQLLREDFSHQKSFDGKKFYCTLSCGLVSVPEDTATLKDVLRYVECGLEDAKQKGKNRMEYFSSRSLKKSKRSIALTEILRESIENGYQGFSLNYQPIFINDKVLAGAEALARFECEEYGKVPPVEFIPLLEESGLILEAGKWIFRQAAAVCKKWLSFKPDFLMGINISCLQLEDGVQNDFMRETLAELELDPGRIIIEATESYLAENIAKFFEVLRDIHNMGIQVSMDDFGTGYSSLGILKHAPFDIVKIDQTFIKGIRDSAFDQSFIQLVVELCHTIGIKVCIEGVEEEEEYSALNEIELDYLQGYLFGRPVTEEVFEEMFLR